MDKFVSNWYIIAVAFVLILLCITMVLEFFKLPTKEQRRKVKEWLLFAVTEAEKELGSGTGQLKLRKVYDMFCTRFPAVAQVISFDTFCMWIDEALERMKGQLQENKMLREYVQGKEG